MERSIVVYTVIKLVGAAYLIYLGVQAFRHRKSLASALQNAVPVPAPRHLFAQGIVVGVSNPKGFLLFAAILPQFTEPASGRVPLQMLLLGMVCVLIVLVSDGVWACLAGSARTWLGRSPRRLEILGGGAGAVRVGLGVQVAISGRRD